MTDENIILNIEDWKKTHRNTECALFLIRNHEEGYGTVVLESKEMKELKKVWRGINESDSDDAYCIAVGSILNIEDWQNAHSKRFFVLVDCSKGNEGEALGIISSNKPEALQLMLNRRENTENCRILQGRLVETMIEGD